MTEHGLAANIHIEPPEFLEASGQAAAQRIFSERPETTALVCLNDLVALEAMSAAAQAGLRVPDDIAIRGYDNTFLAGIDAVGLTSVNRSRANRTGRRVVARFQ